MSLSLSKIQFFDVIRQSHRISCTRGFTCFIQSIKQFNCNKIKTCRLKVDLTDRNVARAHMHIDCRKNITICQTITNYLAEKSSYNPTCRAF